jgi:hypothetical protein
LSELKARHPEVDATFRRIDGQHFSAAIYRDGSAAAQCRIWIGAFGGQRASQIMYSTRDSGNDGSFNEMLSVDDDREAIFLRPMNGQAHRGAPDDGKLTQQGAAEHFWQIFLEPLQR